MSASLQIKKEINLILYLDTFSWTGKEISRWDMYMSGRDGLDLPLWCLFLSELG